MATTGIGIPGFGKASLDVSQVATANTARDGSGTLATAKTAGTYGSTVSSVDIVGTGSTTAGMIRLFLHDGTNARLLDEIPVEAITPSATVEVFSATWTPATTLILPTGWSLRASTHNAETFNVVTKGADY